MKELDEILKQLLDNAEYPKEANIVGFGNDKSVHISIEPDKQDLEQLLGYRHSVPDVIIVNAFLNTDGNDYVEVVDDMNNQLLKSVALTSSRREALVQAYEEKTGDSIETKLSALAEIERQEEEQKTLYDLLRETEFYDVLEADKGIVIMSAELKPEAFAKLFKEEYAGENDVPVHVSFTGHMDVIVALPDRDVKIPPMEGQILKQTAEEYFGIKELLHKMLADSKQSKKHSQEDREL